MFLTDCKFYKIK